MYQSGSNKEIRKHFEYLQEKKIQYRHCLHKGIEKLGTKQGFINRKRSEGDRVTGKS